MPPQRKALIWTDGANPPVSWIPIEELWPDQKPPDDRVVFHVDFRNHHDFHGLIDDGMRDGGAIFASPFSKWRPNPQVIGGNRDVVNKPFAPQKTLFLRGDGLVMRAFPDPSSPTGYSGAGIQTRQAMVEVGMRVDVEFCVPSCPPGIHMTPGWLMPEDGSTDAELDLREFVGNNHIKLDGPIDQYVNAKSKAHGSFGKFLPGTATKHSNWLIASVIRLPDSTIFLSDGVEVHRTPNVYGKRMSILSTIEGGGNGGKNHDEFPGKFRPNSNWPAEQIIKRITVTRL